MKTRKNIINIDVVGNKEILRSALRFFQTFLVRNEAKKVSFVFVSVLIITVSFAQTSNKKRVLIIPPSRFEFASEFDIETIAKKNEIKSSEVFFTYEKALLNSLDSFQDENFEFVAVDATTFLPYKKLIKYKYGKYNGKHYNSVDLSRFSEGNFKALLEKYNANFVVFITRYEINKQTRSIKGFKRIKYAKHYFDFDIYNLFKQHVTGIAKVKAEAPIPNKEEEAFSLLRVKEVKVAYLNFAKKIVEQLNKPIEIK